MLTPAALKCAFAITLLMAMPAQPVMAAGPLMPSLSVSMSPAGATVELGRNDTVSLNFTGTVQAGMSRFTTMAVTIDCVIEPDWAVNWSPKTMQFSASGSQTFNCTLTVYGNAGRSGGNIDVYANWTTQYSQASDYEQVHVDAELTGPGLFNMTATQPPGGGISGGRTGGALAVVLPPAAIVSALAAVFLGWRYLAARKRSRA